MYEIELICAGAQKITRVYVATWQYNEYCSVVFTNSPFSLLYM